MRPGQQNKRSRGRSGRKNVNSLTRNFESNGPDGKVRGNAAHVAEKYVQLARDASVTGDLIMSENYLQHAEHYFRIISAAQIQNQAQNPVQNQTRFEPSGAERISDDEDEAGPVETRPELARTEPARPEPARMNGNARAEEGDDEERSPRREAASRPRRPRRRREPSAGGSAPDPSLAGAPQPSVALETKPDPAPEAPGVVEDAAE